VTLLWNALRLALVSIARNKTRSLLTVLGILIGVASVVSVTTLAGGASAKVGGAIDGFATNALFINPQPTQSSGAKGKATGKLTEGDARAIARESASVALSAPFLSAQVQVVYQSKNALTMIAGSTLSYFPIRRYEIDKGALWTESDEIIKAKVVVLGATVADKLFSDEDPIGQIVRIRNTPFRVIGIMKRRGTSPFGEDQDDRILSPIGSVRSRVSPTSPGRCDMILVSATTERTVERATTQIEEVLRQRHRIAPEGEPDFVVASQAEFRKMQEGITSALSALLLGVAAISLLVGGIGVMNIMLVSVTERTREIGIRMSIGARERDILLQFLVEAVVLTCIGGIVGMTVGGFGTMLVGKIFDWEVVPTPASMGVAMLSSSLIGVTFGFFPARRAAKLDPIDALRVE
jgi:putative ABC transport system permease protein